MKKAFAAFAVIVFMASVLPFVYFDAADDGSLRIQEVMPYGRSEGVTLFNYGSVAADLAGYTIDDGEGSVTFTRPLMIGANSSVTILAGEPDKWIHRDNVRIIGMDGIVSDGFQLNNGGDEVILRSESVTDVFVYGSGTHEDWKGPSVQIPNGRIASRTSIIDTDSAKDWTAIVPGRTSLTTYEYEASVIPFTLPESSGVPVFDALGSAESYVLISIYILDHPVAVSILTDLLEKNVSVTILMEGSVAGGVPESEIRMMEHLRQNGADVYVMKKTEDFRRYSYLHNKYAVIDSETVIITSENWRTSSFESNRGWGTIVHSNEFAGYMEDVFEDSISPLFGDIHGFSEIYSGVTPLDPGNLSYAADEYASFDCFVSPMITPDFAFDSMVDLISSAERRVYSQQLSSDLSWLSGISPVTAMMDVSSKGVDARLMIDVTFDSPDDDDHEDGYQMESSMRGSAVAVMTSDESNVTGLIHNKGTVVDDAVWIGSMNWNYSSFGNNREAGVIIRSAEVADIFASLFESDWGAYAGEIKLVADVYKGPPLTLDASRSSVPSGTVFEWDLDSDGTTDRTGSKIVADLPPGTRECILRITDENGVEHSLRFSVSVGESEKPLPYLKYIPIAVLCAIILAVRYIRKRSSNDKRTSRKRYS